MRQPMVEDALDWAYRQGFYRAELAAEEYAAANGLLVQKIDLGQYGDMLNFVLKD